MSGFDMEDSRRTELVADLLEGALDEQGERELLALLREDREFALEVSSLLSLDALMQTRAHVVGDGSFVERVLACAGYADNVSEFVEKVSGRVEELRDAASVRRVSRRAGFRLLLLAAAVVLAAAGVWWGVMNAEWGRVAAGRGAVFGKVLEAGDRDRIVAPGDRRRSTSARKGREVRVGDSIETGSGQGLKLDMADGGWVRVCQNSKLTIPESATGTGGWTLNLELGRLAANVAARPQGMSALVILTPQAKIQVKGTRFALGVDAKSTRLEVLEGLVGITRLSDGQSVDVAAGQYAVAAEGVELLALALSEDALRAAEAELGQAGRSGSGKSRYGSVLFEDEFDGTLANWEVVLGSRAGGSIGIEDLKPIEGDLLSSHARIQKNFKHKNEAYLRQSGVLYSCLVLDTQFGPDRFVGIRSKKEIEADRFVVEVRFGLDSKKSLSPRRGNTEVWPLPFGVYAAESPTPRTFSQIWNVVRRWEFTPAPERGEDVFLCRGHSGFLRLNSKGVEAGTLSSMEPCHLQLKNKRLLFGICGPDWDLVMDRVTVREILDGDVAAGGQQ